ncbi:RHS repeat-associated core domain-containing protein, partial [Burkholderia ambifaria]|uniref:RHS repeat-associated core domain-containing protein n=1 Tax=Burkholderia ambifaria TaxID=152480 RepID=UPI002FCC1A8F
MKKNGNVIAGPVTIREDEQGRKVRTLFDGAGRIVQHDVYDIDSQSPEWYVVLSRQFDAMGRISIETHSDWTSEDRQKKRTRPSISDQIVYGYDSWGNLSTVRRSDGAEIWIERDPVKLTQTVFQKSTAASDLISGRIVTEFDEHSLHPKKSTAHRSDGSVDGYREYEWDGLGRLCKETDERSHATLRTYDVYGRVLTQTLPDGSVVSRTYAPHLTGEQAATISLTASGDRTAQCLGEQWFDGLGRKIRHTCGGRITTYHYDATPPAPMPDSITLPSGQTSTHTYIPELGFLPNTVNSGSQAQTFQYHPQTAALLKATEGQTDHENQWHPSGALKSQTFTRSGHARTVSYGQTLLAQTETYTDITGKQTRYDRDQYGRLTALADDILSVSLEYDALGRLKMRTVKDVTTATSLVTTLAYDDFSREISRTISDGANVKLELQQSWLPNGLLASRSTQKDGKEVLGETYEYDSRNRLISYRASSAQNNFPLDAYGHPVRAQQYHHDALNNLQTVDTTLADGASDTATFRYENPHDPAQLTSVMHTAKGYPSPISLSYDEAGRLIQDDAGRKLAYDGLGRLASLGEVTYGYDALDRLVRQHIGSNDIRELYYRGEVLVNEVNTVQNRENRFIKTGDGCVGISDGNDLILMAGDAHGSPVWSHQKGQANGALHLWSPWGQGRSEKALPGFNGERTDPVSGMYHLGNGYRAYNPVLMRFNGPDSLSPFGAGGINPYAYCAGDPVNHTDPSGHLSAPAIAGIALGAIGIGLSILTGGASIAAAGSVMAALGAASGASLLLGAAGIAADVTAIASGATEEVSPEASAVLGWVSLATGLAGAAIGVRQ